MNWHAPIALVLLVGLGAACGVGQPHAAATPSPDLMQRYHQAAQCVRDHGQPDFPDPTVDANGNAHLPDGVQKPSDQVLNACKSFLDRLPANANPNNHPDPQMMLRFAQCMRQQGIDDWPDPDAQGRFHFPPSLAGDIKRGPRWSQISAAWNGPCARYNPSGSIEGAP